jgi:hypothetical protein
MAEIFERASKKKLRFETQKGLMSTEDLWDLSLASLDTLAKNVNKKLKDENEESFITPKSSKASTELTLKLDILKHVIAIKIAEKERATTNAQRKEELETLKGLLASKKVDELKGLSSEEIQSRISALAGTTVEEVEA